MTVADPQAQWPIVAARAAATKVDDDVVVIDVGELLVVTGFFVIASARNARLVRAVVDAIEKAIDEAGGPKPKRIEGLDDFRWVLMDYGDFIVHVFDPDARAFYDLERLWQDAPRVEWRDDSERSDA